MRHPPVCQLDSRILVPKAINYPKLTSFRASTRTQTRTSGECAERVEIGGVCRSIQLGRWPAYNMQNMRTSPNRSPCCLWHERQLHRCRWQTMPKLRSDIRITARTGDKSRVIKRAGVEFVSTLKKCTPEVSSTLEYTTGLAQLLFLCYGIRSSTQIKQNFNNLSTRCTVVDLTELCKRN